MEAFQRNNLVNSSQANVFYWRHLETLENQ